MMRTEMIFVVLVLVLLTLLGSLPQVVTAAETGNSAIALQDAVGKALANNPEIRELQSRLQQSRRTVDEFRSQRLPKLSLNGLYTTSDDIKRQLPDANQAVAHAEEPLFQGGRAAADIRRLKSLQDSSSADLEVKRLDVVLAVEQAYFHALADQEQVTQWARAQEEYARLLQLIEPRFTVGSVPEFDFVKIRLSIAQYEQERLHSRQALEHELFVLGALMASDPPGAVQVLPAVHAPPALELDRLMEHLPSRPDVRSAESQLSAQQFALLRARRERWPDLSLSGDYGYSGQSPSDVTLGWGFATTASLPLFDFGTLRARVLQAESERSAQEYRVESLRLKIRTEMNDALQAVKGAWQDLQTAQESIPLAQKAYESSLRRYRTGLAPMTELSEAHDLWVQSRMHLSQATADYRVAAAQLSAAQGLLPETPK